MIDKHIWQSVKDTTEQLRDLDMTLCIDWSCKVDITTGTRAFDYLDQRRPYINVADQSLKFFKDEA
jgi:hypothetical protein